MSSVREAQAAYYYRLKGGGGVQTKVDNGRQRGKMRISGGGVKNLQFFQDVFYARLLGGESPFLLSL